MFDRKLRELIDPTLDRMGMALATRGVRADAVTLVGLGLGVVAALAVAVGAFVAAAIALLANRLCDGLDGAVARARGRTPAGGFLDIVCDFTVYGAIPLAFALQNPVDNALPAAALLFSFYVNGAAFLAFATLAAQDPDLGGDDGRKSFHYLWGMAEGAETILVFMLMVLIPTWFAPLAWGFAAICLVSGLARIGHGVSLARRNAARR